MAKKEIVVASDAAEFWWLVFLEGLMALLVGWLLLSRPVVTTLFLIQFLGLYWLMVGILDVVRALVEKEGSPRVWQMFGGVVGVMAGLFVLNNPIFAGVVTQAMLMWIIAFTFIFNGLLQIFLGNREHDAGAWNRSWGSFFVGTFYIVFGLLILSLPFLTTVAIMVVVSALLAIVGGVGMMVFAFRLRKEVRK